MSGQAQFAKMYFNASILNLGMKHKSYIQQELKNKWMKFPLAYMNMGYASSEMWYNYHPI